MKVEAWRLVNSPKTNKLTYNQGEIILPELSGDMVRISPLYASWEGNMSHAVSGIPVNVCLMRNEPQILVGNSALVRVDEVGPHSRRKPGELCIIHGAHVCDEHGHMLAAMGFDGAGSMGTIAKSLVISGRKLVPIGLGLDEIDPKAWALFGCKYGTAWSSFEIAVQAFRLYVSEIQKPTLNVWGWGGGTTMATLQLAKILGHKATMIVNGPEKSEEAIAHGIDVLDRREFEDIKYYNPIGRSKEDGVKYKQAASALLKKIRSKSGPGGVDIFFDYVGDPTMELTSRALGRYGVMATAGWKDGVLTGYNRARASIFRQIHIHTHYCSRRQLVAAVEFAKKNNWLAKRSLEFSYDEVLTLHEMFNNGKLKSYLPVVKIN